VKIHDTALEAMLQHHENADSEQEVGFGDGMGEYQKEERRLGQSSRLPMLFLMHILEVFSDRKVEDNKCNNRKRSNYLHTSEKFI